MANVPTRAHVLRRDGFRCRYCGARLYLAQAIKLLDLYAPGLNLYDPHGNREPLRSCWATVDHVIAEVAGGFDTLENLVACCVVCNSRKGCGEPLFSESGRSADDGWDGLCGVFVALAARFPEALNIEDRKWLEAMRREKIEESPDAVEAAVASLFEIKESVFSDDTTKR